MSPANVKRAAALVHMIEDIEEAVRNSNDGGVLHVGKPVLPGLPALSYPASVRLTGEHTRTALRALWTVVHDELRDLGVEE